MRSDDGPDVDDDLATGLSTEVNDDEACELSAADDEASANSVVASTPPEPALDAAAVDDADELAGWVLDLLAVDFDEAVAVVVAVWVTFTIVVCIAVVVTTTGGDELDGDADDDEVLGSADEEVGASVVGDEVTDAEVVSVGGGVSSAPAGSEPAAANSPTAASSPAAAIVSCRARRTRRGREVGLDTVFRSGTWARRSHRELRRITASVNGFA